MKFSLIRWYTLTYAMGKLGISCIRFKHAGIRWYTLTYARGKLGISCIRFKHAGIREREMFYLTTHSTHFIYGYMASDIWLRTILIVRNETRFRHIGYSYRLAARVLLYAPSHRQDNTYHGLCYTSRGWHTLSYAVIRWSYAEYAVHTPTYAGICGHSRSKTLLIGSIRYQHGMHTPNSVFSRAFCAYEKYFINFHTQFLRFSHTQQCERAIDKQIRLTTYELDGYAGLRDAFIITVASPLASWAN